MRKEFRTHSRSRRLSGILFLVLLLALCLAPAAFADEVSGASENPDAAVRMSGKKAVLYNPKTGAVYRGFKKVKQIPAGSKYYYYFRKKTGVVYNSGFFKAGKRTYYARKNGQLMTGIQKIGKYGYYFTRKGVMKSGGFIKTGSNGTYYASGNGRLKRGLKKINGKYYYFDKTSYQMQCGWIKSGSYTYFMRTSNFNFV